MNKEKQKKISRETRRRRARSKIFGTNDRPRLSFFRSNKNVYAQIIDDSARRTLIGASSLKADERGAVLSAEKMGSEIADRAIGSGIKRVVFDRGGFLYTGSVKAFADAARAGGLQF